ncbi:ataxin-2-like protein isoform X4 [Ornithodoros turicata]|uniref:ataxin-2-like protein isoform X4 n=1 Tax=Ornithodoros turicata TaxID=34597 RepID=UPI003138794B
MSGDTKRKNKNSTRPARSKGVQERKYEGIYSNARFVHIAASLVGQVVQVQVRDGDVFEGVFRTFSPELEIVLEMAHPIDRSLAGLGSSITTLLSSLNNSHTIVGLMIFRLHDVVTLSAVNTDLDFAIRDSFTDTAISKFNGQAVEKPLEPWLDGGMDGDGLPVLDDGAEGDETQNGWDANEMFKTNAEKYGVTTSYNSDLSGYTVKLEPKNTDEYKLQEAKASKIAQEIESNPLCKKRADQENGDEEERFSAVVRPAESTPQGNSRFVRRKPPSGTKPVRGTPPPMQQQQQQQQQQQVVRSTAPQYKSSPGGPQGGCPSPALATKSSPAPPMSGGPHHGTKHPPLLPSYHEAEQQPPPPPPRMNGAPKVEKDATPVPVMNVDNKVLEEGSMEQPEHRVGEKPDSRKGAVQKGRVEEIEELKKFSTSFKLSEENKENKEHSEESLMLEADKEKEKSELDSGKEDAEKLVKKSTLNPNAKEFVLNPNAKSFTPRTLLPLTSPPARMPQTTSPMVAPPQQLVPGQHIITMAPQYLMQATPVSMAQFAPTQGPRFRKGAQTWADSRFVPLMHTTAGRQDLPTSVHVTGQPILAPAALPTPTQLMVQYAPAQGMMHASGHPQAAVAYPQMYQMVGHRVMSPQPVGMVTPGASYGDGSHLPAQVYMSHPAVLPQGAGTPHSNPPTPGGGGSGGTPGSTPSQAPTPPVVYHAAQGPPQGGGGPPPQPVVLMPPPHSGANTPPHLLPHGPMVPPQMATTHFVHHQVLPRLFPPGNARCE